MNTAVTQLSLTDLQKLLPSRSIDAHKGLSGHVLVIGSDLGMPGAVRITAEGAARIGAGLVTVATRKEHLLMRPEILCYGISAGKELDPLLKKANMIVIGPGLGQYDWSEDLFQTTLKTTAPLLLDADALNLMTKNNGNYYRENSILTPHPGEAARLLNISTNDVQSNRTETILSLQKKFGGIIVLKGSRTLITSSEHIIYECPYGNAGMATAGMGDLLSGMIAGLVAQGIDLLLAAKMGVVIHASAGDMIAKQNGIRGILTMDLLSALPVLLNPT